MVRTYFYLLSFFKIILLRLNCFINLYKLHIYFMLQLYFSVVMLRNKQILSQTLLHNLSLLQNSNSSMTFYIFKCFQDKFKREIKLDVKKHLKIGLEVAVGKMRFYGRKGYIYKHHGIVTNICDITETFEIIELTAPGSSVNFFPALSRSSLQPKVVKSSIKFTTENLFYYQHTNVCVNHKIIKERAESMFHLFESCGVKYHLYKFNCEHFASYCATGMAYSKQSSYSNIDATATLDKR